LNYNPFMPRPQLVDSNVLEAALVGLEHKKSELDQQIAAVRKQLGGRAHQLTVRLCRRPSRRKRAQPRGPEADCPSDTAEMGRLAEGEGGKQVTRDLNVSDPRDWQSCYSSTMAVVRHRLRFDRDRAPELFIRRATFCDVRTHFVTLTSGLRLPDAVPGPCPIPNPATPHLTRN
jgi:hypothetical protein